MAILKGGINGPFSGKVGNIVGYELNGQAIIRSLPDFNKKKPSPLTVINRNRMKAVSKFLKPIKKVVQLGYRNIAPVGSRVGAFQTAQSHLFKTALDYDTQTIPYVNPEKALIFRGDLASPVVVSMVKTNEELQLEWEPRQYVNSHYSLLVLAYDLEMHWTFYEGGIAASTGSLNWRLSRYIAERPQLHIYIAAFDVFTGEMSDSVYAGCV